MVRIVHVHVLLLHFDMRIVQKEDKAIKEVVFDVYSFDYNVPGVVHYQVIVYLV